MSDRLLALDKELRYFAGIRPADWTAGENNDRYTRLDDDLIDLLTTKEGEPAVNNIIYMRHLGWRISVVNKTDKTMGEFWYGQIYVWGPYGIVFKWTGEDSVGV